MSELVKNNRRLHLPLLILAFLALLAGLWAGLLRLGLALPSLGIIPAGAHGPLMVAGFLGTLIALERAVALRQGRQLLPGSTTEDASARKPDSLLYFLVPLLSGLGALLIFLNLPLSVPRVLFALSALGFTVLSFMLVRRLPDKASATLAAGAVLYLVGCLMWLFGALFPQLVPWWIVFLVFTIAGERLELSRLRRPSSAAQTAYVAILAAIIIGLLVSLVNLGLGMRIMGLGLIVLALWLIRFDIARKTVRRKGITGYIGACLLTGFIWLAAGGLLWVLQGGRSTAGPLYDAMLHALLLGFVMSMIFGHGPVILPAITGRSITYLPMFYIPLGLLHLTLILRIAGDFLNQADLRKIGAIGNEVAILLFLLAMAAGVRQSRRDQSAHLAAKLSKEG